MFVNVLVKFFAEGKMCRIIHRKERGSSSSCSKTRSHFNTHWSNGTNSWACEAESKLSGNEVGGFQGEPFVHQPFVGATPFEISRTNYTYGNSGDTIEIPDLQKHNAGHGDFLD